MTLAPDDIQLVAQCLRAAVDGGFFDDWELQTLFGLDRSEVAAVARRWPDVDRTDDNVRLAVQNAMANLWGYPHGREAEWRRYSDVSLEEVHAALQRVTSWFEADG